MAGRSVRRYIADLGYQVHPPAELFGRQRLNEGVADEEWLPIVGGHGWAVIGRDYHILTRELELQAYLRAKVHMFLLPGTATREQILSLVATDLAHVCVGQASAACQCGSRAGLRARRGGHPATAAGLATAGLG